MVIAPVLGDEVCGLESYHEMRLIIGLKLLSALATRWLPPISMVTASRICSWVLHSSTRSVMNQRTMLEELSTCI